MNADKLIYPELSSFESADAGSGFFGLDHKPSDALIQVLPVAWEGSTSQGSGASACFPFLQSASHYVDLHHERYGSAYRAGIACNDQMLSFSKQVQAKCKDGDKATVRDQLYASILNELKKQTKTVLKQGSIPVVVGGDHSVPLGAMLAIDDGVSAQGQEWGILHLDAHLDMRRSYEGMQNSHASIMYHVSQNARSLRGLVSVGIRDYCREEILHAGSISAHVLSDRKMRRRLAQGKSLSDVFAAAIKKLPEKVYLSFDIDGLDMTLCPSTGTPVPGGLLFHEMQLLLDLVVESGREVVGADLCEVVCVGGSPHESVDAIVGARVLWELCNAAIASRIGNFV